jgi:hypothetical protein
MNPKKFGKLANDRQEPWKQPLPQFIEHIYSKHFGKACPHRVLSLEDWAVQTRRTREDERNWRFMIVQRINCATLPRGRPECPPSSGRT